MVNSSTHDIDSLQILPVLQCRLAPVCSGNYNTAGVYKPIADSYDAVANYMLKYTKVDSDVHIRVSCCTHCTILCTHTHQMLYRAIQREHAVSTCMKSCGRCRCNP